MFALPINQLSMKIPQREIIQTYKKSWRKAWRCEHSFVHEEVKSADKS